MDNTDHLNAGFDLEKTDPAQGILEDNTATKELSRDELVAYFADRGITILRKGKDNA